MIPEGAKKIVIVGQGKAVGKPLHEICMRQGLNVQALETHPDKCPNWREYLKESGADVVIGCAGFLPKGLTPEIARVWVRQHRRETGELAPQPCSDPLHQDV